MSEKECKCFIKIFLSGLTLVHNRTMCPNVKAIKKPHRSGARKVFSMSKACRLKQIPHPTCVMRCSTCVDADYATSARQHNQPYKMNQIKENDSSNILSGLQFQFTTYDEIHILMKLATELSVRVINLEDLEHT